MLGFFLGTIGVISLIHVIRRRHGYGYCGRVPYAAGGCGPGFGYGGHGGRWRFAGRRWLLRSLFERLETTPGQEKAIMAALQELRENRAAIFDEMKQTRADLGRVVAGGLVDDSSLEETFARHDRLLAQLRVAFVEALKKITEALDESQRKTLSDVLSRGGWFGGGPRWSDPYRNMWV